MAQQLVAARGDKGRPCAAARDRLVGSCPKRSAAKARRCPKPGPTRRATTGGGARDKCPAQWGGARSPTSLPACRSGTTRHPSLPGNGAIRRSAPAFGVVHSAHARLRWLAVLGGAGRVAVRGGRVRAACVWSAGVGVRVRFTSLQVGRPSVHPVAAPGHHMEGGLRNAIVFNASKGEAFTLVSGYKSLRKRLRGNWKVQR